MSAPSVVQSAANFVGATTPSSISATLVSPTSLGNTIILCFQGFAGRASAADISVSDDAGNTYVPVDLHYFGAASQVLAVYSCENSSHAASVFTVTVVNHTQYGLGMEDAILMVTELTAGVGFYPSVDQYAVSTSTGTSSTTVSFPGVTTSEDAELILAHAMILIGPSTGSTPFTAGAGYSITTQLKAGLSGTASWYTAGEAGSAATIGTYTPSMTFSGAGTLWEGSTSTLSLKTLSSGVVRRRRPNVCLNM